MNFFKSMNLRLRKLAWRVYHIIAPIVSKTRIGKVRIGKYTLGYRINLLFNKALNFKPPESIELKGMTIYHRSLDGRGWFGWCYAFDYEPETCIVFEQIVRLGMTVVDVGAHIGYYTLLAASLVGEKGKVYAFEPDPSYYKLLIKNIEANRLGASIEPFRMAIGNMERKATLFLGRSTGTSLFKIHDITDQTAVVEVLSLDKFFADRDWLPVQVIKLDIEGAEKIALEGMRELVRKNLDLRLIIELNPSFLEAAGTSPEDTLILLDELGFSRIQVLHGEMKFYKIPQDIKYLASLGRELMYVNLLCERYP